MDTLSDPNSDADPELKKIWAIYEVRRLRALRAHKEEEEAIMDAFKSDVEAYCLKKYGSVPPTPTLREHRQLIAEAAAKNKTTTAP